MKRSSEIPSILIPHHEECMLKIYIRSFILVISIAPLQVLYYTQKPSRLYTARIHVSEFHPEACIDAADDIYRLQYNLFLPESLFLSLSLCLSFCVSVSLSPSLVVSYDATFFCDNSAVCLTVCMYVSAVFLSVQFCLSLCACLCLSSPLFACVLFCLCLSASFCMSPVSCTVCLYEEVCAEQNSVTLHTVYILEGIHTQMTTTPSL